MKRLILILALILLPTGVFAVDTLLVTVKESGGNYTNVEAALDAHAQNLAVNDSVLVIEISGTWTNPDSFEVSVDGYDSTDATHPIIIRAVGDSRHNGTWSTTAYRHERPATDTVEFGCYSIAENCVRLEWLQIHQKVNRHWDCGINTKGVGSANNDVRISNCIIKGTDGSNNTRKGINVDGWGGYDVWNCLIYDFDTPESRGIESKYTTHLYNNTIWDCNQGIYVKTMNPDGDDCKAKNNLVGNCNEDNYSAFGSLTFDSESDHNGSDDATSTGGANDHINHTFTFENEGADNFHLAITDTGATDYGTDLSADADRPFDEDIDGDTRSGTWDMGADEYPFGPSATLVRKVTLREVVR